MAANGVNLKMGVSGIAQFKQNMNQAKQAVKTLDAQLALTEKQFKASGDAESYMTEKSELLKAKLKQQEAVVQSAEKALQDMADRGVQKTSKAYQDMYREMINAKGAMLDTQQSLDNIAGAASDADVAVSDMDNTLGNIGKNVSIDNVKSALTTMTSGMESVMKKAVQIGSYIARHVLGAGDWADDLNTRAAIYEMDPEELQRMEKTADLIDTSVDAIIQAKRRMTKAIGTGSADTVDALEALGLGNVVDTDPEEMFWKIGDAIMNLGDAYEREEAAQKLFGRSWSELIPLFDAGREKYEEMNASWNVVPKESLDALQEADDAVETLNNELDTAQKQLEAAMAPAVTEVTKALTGLVEQFNIYMQSEDGKKMMDSLSTAVTSLFDDITKINPEQTMNTVIGVIDQIKEGLEWIKENKDGVVTAVEAFIGTWALLKTASGVTTVLELINGIKGMSAAKMAAAGSAAGGSWAGAFASAAMKAAPFLAFLYTLLHPASGSDKIGDNTLEDEEGNLTREAEEYGIKKDENGELYLDADAINPEYTNPEYLAWLKKNQRENELYSGFNMTPEQAAAAEKFWDEYRENPTGFSDSAWDEFEGAFAGQEELFNNLNELMDLLVQRDRPDDWQTLTDLPEYFYRKPAGSNTFEKSFSYLANLPGQVKEAVQAVIGSMNVYLDGQKVGEMTAPYVDEQLAGAVYAE